NSALYKTAVGDDASVTAMTLAPGRALNEIEPERLELLVGVEAVDIYVKTMYSAVGAQDLDSSERLAALIDLLGGLDVDQPGLERLNELLQARGAAVRIFGDEAEAR